MKALTVDRLRAMAVALDLPLSDEDLARLRPMVEDLMAVGRRLRENQPGEIGRSDLLAGESPSSG
jgi:hypothetical protein